MVGAARILSMIPIAYRSPASEFDGHLGSQRRMFDSFASKLVMMLPVRFVTYEEVKGKKCKGTHLDSLRTWRARV